MASMSGESPCIIWPRRHSIVGRRVWTLYVVLSPDRLSMSRRRDPRNATLLCGGLVLIIRSDIVGRHSCWSSYAAVPFTLPLRFLYFTRLYRVSSFEPTSTVVDSINLHLLSITFYVIGIWGIIVLTINNIICHQGRSQKKNILGGLSILWKRKLVKIYITYIYNYITEFIKCNFNKSRHCVRSRWHQTYSLLVITFYMYS